MELKAAPEGSRPTRFQSASPSSFSASTKVKSLVMLCSENGVWALPTLWVWPSTVAIAMPNW